MNPSPRLAPTLTPTPLDIAWAAGFYEGEGSCNKASGRYGWSVQVEIAQVQEWPVQRMRDLFGGSLGPRSMRSYNERCRQQYRWRVSGPRARAFLDAVMPYLSPARIAQIQRTYDPQVGDGRSA